MHNVVDTRCGKLEPALTPSALTRQHELVVATVATGDGPVKRHTEALPHVLLCRQLPRSRRDHSHVPAWRRRVGMCARVLLVGSRGGGGKTHAMPLTDLLCALVFLHFSCAIFTWL